MPTAPLNSPPVDGQMPGKQVSNVRSRRWDERSLTEQVESLREEVRSLRAINNYLGTMVERLLRHQHSAKGELLTALSAGQGVYAGPPDFTLYDPLA